MKDLARHGLPTRLNRFAAALLLCLFGIGLAGGEVLAADNTEYRLKAALIYKLTKFVQWPSMDRAGGAFTMCMVGRHGFGSALDAMRNREVNNLPVTIRDVATQNEIGVCNMAFVTKDGLLNLPGALDTLARQGALTISDERGFASQGGMVELAARGRRLVFRVNRKQAAIAGLRFSAPFLEIAVLVGE